MAKARKKILIIEDDEVIVNALTVLLKKDFELDSAENGNVGLEKVQSFNPDLIILDLLMPEKDGFDVARKLKGDDKLKKIPIIALSSFTEMYDMSFGDDAGKSSLPSEVYLSKPLDPQTLMREIKQHLG